jgi:hypothetical protein
MSGGMRGWLCKCETSDPHSVFRPSGGGVCDSNAGVVRTGYKQRARSGNFPEICLVARGPGVAHEASAARQARQNPIAHWSLWLQQRNHR